MLTLNLDEISIVFYENPISRAYLNFFYRENIKIKNFIYLNDKSFLPNKINAYRLFKKNNFHAFRFLKDKNILKLITEFEEFFSIPKNFCLEMYSFSKFGLNKDINFTTDKSINSEQLKNILSEKKFLNNFILNTGNEILKEILNPNLNFFHIHPGYLPDIRGADGSLNSILYSNSIGVTSFLMTDKIDHGNILLREKYDFPKFNFVNYNDYKIKDVYRIWYSFFDPLLRVSHLKKLYGVKSVKIKKLQKNNVGNYYTFLDEKNLKKVFDKIFN